jgi:hypothetical protein
MIAQFSYAELPKYFHKIIGVTGTLETLPKSKQTELAKSYNTKDQYAIPSSFGIEKRRIERYFIVTQ